MSFVVSENASQDWQYSVRDQMTLVNSVISGAINSEVASVETAVSEIVNAGGKRIRPNLVLLSNLACGGGAEPDVLDLAAAVELVHTASLMHDDVVDDAENRRGRPTANSSFGSKISVLAGDFMLSRAFALLARQPKAEVFSVIADVAGVMSESQVLETECLGSLELWQRNYWDCIEGKTAAFMRACCECGVITAGGEGDTKKALGDYGLKIGLSFQIFDDILDVTGRQSKVGKDLGADIISGKFTLPALLAVEIDTDFKSVLLECYRTSDAEKAIRGIIERGAVEQAKRVAAKQIDDAIGALETLPVSDYSKSLVNLAQYIIHRQL